MAEGKKSILLYVDIIHVVEKLDDVRAGILFKTILRYVNDMNPDVQDPIVDIAFEPIKQQLKRDLKRYEKICERNRNNGMKGGRPEEPKKPTGLNEYPNNPNEPDNDNDNDNDNDINVISYKKISLLDLTAELVPENLREYYFITDAYFKLFSNNMHEAGVKDTVLKKAKGTWIDDIRKMIEIDKYDIDQLRAVFRYLEKNEFWKKNIISTEKLRKQFPKLLMQIKYNGQDKRNSEGASISELFHLTRSNFG